MSPDGTAPSATREETPSAARHRGTRAGRSWRTRFVILPQLQLRLCFYHGLAAVFFTLILVSSMVGPDVATLLWIDGDEEMVLAAADHLLSVHEVIWPSLALGLVFLTVVSIAVSHRLAGPLYRLRCVFTSLREGHLPARVRLRRRDFLHEEARILEEAIGGLRSMLRGVSASHAALTKELESAREAARLGAALHAKDLERLLETAKELEAHVRAFELEPEDEGARS